MNLPKFTGPGSTQVRRSFWDSIADSVQSFTKQQGKNVSVQEFSGQGTIINIDRKPGGPTTGGVPCLLSVHATLCFRWYPVGFPPGIDCVVTVSEEIDIPITLIECPVDFTVTGPKFSFTGDLVSALNTGTDCPTPMVNPSHFASTTLLGWDATLMQWKIYVKLVFAGWPATFTYGPVFVSGEDLTAAGPITITSDSCPSFCTSSVGCTNPVSSIVIRFFA